MEIHTIMSKTVITVNRDTASVDICRLMDKHHIGSVVVVDAGLPAGIVTERDIVSAVAAKAAGIVDLTAQDLMIAPVTTVGPDMDIHEAIEIMKNKRIRRLPIVQSDRMVGIVTYGDILRFMRGALDDSASQVKVLKDEAERDALTGVFNRKYFNRALKREVGRVKERGGFLSLLMIDVDNFKTINDTFGHDAGDTLLVQIASMIVLHVREINLVCRFGGDEFAVIAPISDILGAVRMAERLRQVVETAMVFYKQDKLDVTLSIGVASWETTMENTQGLLIAADMALYQAKKEGRNCVRRAPESVPGALGLPAEGDQ